MTSKFVTFSTGKCLDTAKSFIKKKKNCAKEESSVGCGDLLAMKSIVGVSLLVFLFVAVRVQGERVIRAAEHAEKTGRYIVKLRSETSREVFEQTLKNALFFSDDSIVYTKNERAFKFFVLKLSEESANKVYAYSAPVGICPCIVLCIDSIWIVYGWMGYLIHACVYIYLQVKELEGVEYVEEETIAHGARYETTSWALDRIDQRDGNLDGIYDPGPGRDGEGVNIYILDTGWSSL